MCCNAGLCHLKRGAEVAALEQQQGAQDLGPRCAEDAVVASCSASARLQYSRPASMSPVVLQAKAATLLHVAAVAGACVRPGVNPRLCLRAQVDGVVTQRASHMIRCNGSAQSSSSYGRPVCPGIVGQSRCQRFEVGQFALESRRARAARRRARTHGSGGSGGSDRALRWGISGIHRSRLAPSPGAAPSLQQP